MDDEAQVKSTRVYKTRIGLVKGAVWLNDTFYSATITRSYQKDDEDGKPKWHDTTTFGHDDLLNVAKVAERCENYIAGRRS